MSKENLFSSLRRICVEMIGIMMLNLGSDGQIRSVSLKLESGNIVDRSVNKWTPLELSVQEYSTEREISKPDT
ncbi:hypothetical protein L596_022138 [Steinernema carpocapsae]|uniref:Uncharacterized protein n=1 Tax=Steinernema carpocapsae TaxID=34508 RepID=A0A4U5MKV9_STECR|nr:hypothetical protein L596_022138 [Steinernema carpocapsae]